MERRSRLSPEREAEIFEAVERLVREHGYEKVTMQQIAEEARASTATLYRRWDGKPRLVVEALKHRRPAPVEGIDTGSLRGDLLACIGAVVRSAPEDHHLMSGIANAARSDDDLDRAQREVLIEPMRKAIDAMLDLAIARGEFSPDSPAREFVPELLFAAAIGHRVHTGRFPDEAYLIRFVDTIVLPSLGVRQL